MCLFASYTRGFSIVPAGLHTRWQAGLLSHGSHSEALQKLLQLGDDFGVHCLHEGLEALLSQQLLLGLELLVDELLQGHGVHGVLQGQLWDREEPHCVTEAKQGAFTWE